MSTINLKISVNGSLTAANPLAKAGHKHLIYAIHEVPDGVTVQECVQQANRICFAHRYADDAAYTYKWADIVGKPQGAIINRY